MKAIRNVLGLAGCLLLGACSLFARPVPEQATIRVYPVPAARIVTLTAVDGQALADGQQALVSPGAHRLSLRLDPQAPGGTGCQVELSHARFEANQVYGVFEGDWNGTATLFLKGARGELLDTRNLSACQARNGGDASALAR